MDERRVHKTWQTPSEHSSILQEADKIINGERQGDYGSPLQSFTTIAKLWGPVLGIEVTPIQVALCMEQLKVARFLNGQDRDSAIDGAGYWGCIELMMREMMDSEGRRPESPSRSSVGRLDTMLSSSPPQNPTL